jgi:hypothetical protein
MAHRNDMKSAPKVAAAKSSGGNEAATAAAVDKQKEEASQGRCAIGDHLSMKGLLDDEVASLFENEYGE